MSSLKSLRWTYFKLFLWLGGESELIWSIAIIWRAELLCFDTFNQDIKDGHLNLGQAFCSEENRILHFYAWWKSPFLLSGSKKYNCCDLSILSVASKCCFTTWLWRKSKLCQLKMPFWNSESPWQLYIYLIFHLKLKYLNIVKKSWKQLIF